MSPTEIQDAKNKAFAAVTATVNQTVPSVLELIGVMDEFGEVIDEAARAAVEISTKSSEWFERMLIMTPWFKTDVLKMEWRQVKLAPDSQYIPVVTFKASGLEMIFDPVLFPTEDDVIQITLALKAGQ